MMAIRATLRCTNTAAVIAALLLLVGLLCPPAVADPPPPNDQAEQPVPEAAPGPDDGEATAAAEDSDPFAIPQQADAAELMRFIQRVKRQRGRTIDDIKRSANAAADAAEAICQLADVNERIELLAVRERLGALQFLSRYADDRRDQLSALIDQLQQDPREEFKRLGETEAFKIEIAGARQAGAAAQAELVERFRARYEQQDFDQTAYTLGSMLARSVEDPDAPETAAGLYEFLGEQMAQSEIEQLRERAPRMTGAARRVRLPGNFLELSGTTTEGTPFPWEDYRGKVVLVDFWASWCGPCRAEIPNMKSNLEAYGDRGFAIVGINLDRTLEECQEYVAKEDLTWVNLFSEAEGEQGWDNPVATHYGISGIPTAILVDQAGKVVSLRARGRELNRLLEELLGAPEPATDEEDQPQPDNQEDA